MPTSLEHICHQASLLQQEGKTPSLALLRSRLGKRLHPAELLQAFQQWKQLPATKREALSHTLLSSIAPISSMQPIQATSEAEQLEQLKQRVQQLETLVHELQQRLDRHHVGC